MSLFGQQSAPQVLAIDDESEILDVVRQALEAAGFRVHGVRTPREGLKFFEKHWREIDLVLLDFLMPEMTGDLVFESMLQFNPSVKVLLLTACEDNVAKRMFESGLRGYIQKPFYIDELVQRVSDEIEKP
jgi:DNA-binding response OmpR family regulator